MKKHIKQHDLRPESLKRIAQSLNAQAKMSRGRAKDKDVYNSKTREHEALRALILHDVAWALNEEASHARRLR